MKDASVYICETCPFATFAKRRAELHIEDFPEHKVIPFGTRENMISGGKD